MARPNVVLITQGRLAGKYAVRLESVVTFYDEVPLEDGLFHFELSHPVTRYDYLCELALHAPEGLLRDYGLTREMIEQLPYYDQTEELENPYTLD